LTIEWRWSDDSVAVLVLIVVFSSSSLRGMSVLNETANSLFTIINETEFINQP
jgi:hypothetical protein